MSVGHAMKFPLTTNTISLSMQGDHIGCNSSPILTLVLLVL